MKIIVEFKLSFITSYKGYIQRQGHEHRISVLTAASLLFCNRELKKHKERMKNGQNKYVINILSFASLREQCLNGLTCIMASCMRAGVKL